MQLEEAITNRRSIRKYLPTPVDIETIVQLLDTARWAPSACNRQECYFIIVDNEELITKIVDAGASKLLRNSDKVLFVLYSSLTDNLEYADHVQSASAVIQNFMLLAHEKGIGTCWVCHLPRKKELKKLLAIPDHIEVTAAVSLGYADIENAKPVKRKCEIRDIVGYNRFYSKNPLTNDVAKTYAKIILNKIYHMFPTSLKKRVNDFLDKYLVKKFEN